MSKKGLEKFYKEALPALKQKYKYTNWSGDIHFDNYDAKCYIKKANGQIVEEVIFDIEGLEFRDYGHSMLNRLCNPFTKPRVNIMGGTYRWADDYGRTWALTKEELVR